MYRSFLPFWVVVVLLPTLVCAQDTILHKSKTTGKTVKRKGQIVDWKGGALTIFSANRERRIDNELIIQVQTDWNEHYLAGRKALSSQQFEDAIVEFKAALQQESRPWAKRMIRARLVEAFRATQNQVAAFQQFLAITTEDPQTRFFHLIPLAWTTSSLDSGNAVAAARNLADSKYISARLISASWLLNDTQNPESRAKAKQVLESLAMDIEPKIAQLATMQLWRTKLVTVQQAQLKQWLGRLEQFEPTIRFGGRFLIAEAQARLGQTDNAAISYMNLPVLFPEQHAIIPAALYKCGSVLQNNNRSDEARLVWNELSRKYPHTFWAKQAASRQPAGN